MSITTRDASVELRVTEEGKLSIYFCDANVAQWEEGLDTIESSDGADDLLVDDVAREIEAAAHDLAQTLVDDLRTRMRAKEGKSNG